MNLVTGCQVAELQIGEVFLMKGTKLSIAGGRNGKTGSPSVTKLRAASREGQEPCLGAGHRFPDFVFFGYAAHIKMESVVPNVMGRWKRAMCRRRKSRLA